MIFNIPKKLSIHNKHKVQAIDIDTDEESEANTIQQHEAHKIT
jgi:hypothetical protein